MLNILRIYDNVSPMKSQLFFSFNNEKIPILINKSKRKSLTISLNHLRKITIKAPIFVLNRDIMNFINANTSWIQKKLIHNTQHAKFYNFLIGTTTPLLGNEVDIIQGTHSVVIKYINNNFYLPRGDIDVKKAFIKWYRDYTRKEITRLVDYYCVKQDVKYNKIYIKSQKTRWGSCSSKLNLNFNWKIILTPMHLINYLVIHEVCHLVYMDHSKNFWNLVSKYDKDYIKNRKELQNYGYYLNSFLE